MRRYIIILAILMNCGNEGTFNFPDTSTETKDFLGDAVDSEKSEESLQEVLDANSPEEIQEGIQESIQEACLPDCQNKECGDDGCGGSCGECEQGKCVDGKCCKPHIVGYYNLSIGFARDIVVSKNLLFITDWYQEGLHILDISNPTAPILKGSYSAKGNTWAVTGSADTAYLTVWEEGLLIIDVSDPANPSLKATFKTEHAYNVFWMRDKIYLIDFTTGLHILDVANPANPSLLGEWKADNLRDVFVRGNTAYLVGDQPMDAPKTGLQILDVSDPAHPQLKGLLLDIYGDGVFATKNFVFITYFNKGLKIVNVANPAEPFLVSWFPLKNVSNEIFFSEEEKVGYLAGLAAGLLMMDLADFSAPTIKNQVDTDGMTYGLFVAGNLVYAADGEEGIKVIETCQCLPSCLGKKEGETDGCGGICL